MLCSRLLCLPSSLIKSSSHKYQRSLRSKIPPPLCFLWLLERQEAELCSPLFVFLICLNTFNVLITYLPYLCYAAVHLLCGAPGLTAILHLLKMTASSFSSSPPTLFLNSEAKSVSACRQTLTLASRLTLSNP